MKLNTLFVFSMVALLCGCDDDDDIPVKAGFDYFFTEINEVQFSNYSEGATAYFWDFGDGQTSRERNPTHVFSVDPPYIVKLIAKSRFEADTLILQLYDGFIAYKPNIYIYPTEPLALCLKIDFPLGGEVIRSIPEYIDGWCFNVQPDGTIDNRYRYLFYESKQTDIFQNEKGWCVAKADLKTFFEDNMKQYGFSQMEITDFIDYWIPLLTEKKYYLLYPQTNEIIDQAIAFHFSKQPAHVGRLFYVIKGTSEPDILSAPEVAGFLRDDFYVMEWGVILK